MLRYLKYLLPLFCAFAANGQNFVPNGSFEEHFPIQNGLNYVLFTDCKNWFTATGGTPDYFSATVIDSNSTHYIPDNIAGHEYAIDGNFYAGIFLYIEDVNPEYIEVQLKAPLEAQKKYCVSFYVSLADSISWCSINNVGAYFSQNSIYSSQSVRLDMYTPQVNNSNTNPLTNRLNWTNVSGDFLATGGEQYLTIGNFNPPENYDTINSQGGSIGANTVRSYYYIDSVTVTLCDDVGVNETPIDIIDIYPNPAQDFVNVEISGNYKATQLNIYNLTGQLISQKQLTQPNEQIPTPELGNGMYIFVIQNEDRVIGRHRVVVAR